MLVFQFPEVPEFIPKRGNASVYAFSPVVKLPGFVFLLFSLVLLVCFLRTSYLTREKVLRVSHDCTRPLQAYPPRYFDHVTFFRFLLKKPVEEFLLEPSHTGDRFWESMQNPVAGELGITTHQDLQDFVDNAIPKFKAVIDSSNRNKGGT